MPKVRGRLAILEAHHEKLETIVHGREIWMPTFNYDFLSSGSFAPQFDPSQVGALNESFRKTADWRSNVPVFNFCGTGKSPIESSVSSTIDPFDGDSVFAKLVQLNGSIYWYGAPISSVTFLHHVESVSGGPLYRYDKLFHGQILLGGTAVAVSLKYHVRPLTGPVAYDWDKIIQDGFRAQVIEKVPNAVDAPLFQANARALLELWRDRLLTDPLYLLNQESRAWIEPWLQRLGRRFQIEDFEE